MLEESSTESEFICRNSSKCKQNSIPTSILITKLLNYNCTFVRKQQSSDDSSMSNILVTPKLKGI
jgi:hypothetical protein